MAKFKYEGTALVTGASSGLGEEFARQLAQKGMDLVLVARSKDKLTALASELEEKHGIKVSIVAADLSVENAARGIKKATDDEGLKISLLVNNAGVGTYGRMETLDRDAEHKMVMLNCVAPVDLTHEYLPDLLQQSRGGIIFLGSIAAYQPTPYFATYGATKAFNLMLGEALWAELKDKGISVLSLSPGYTKTHFQETAEVDLNPPGGFKMADEVVRLALRKLGKKPSLVPGKRNKFLAWSIRFTPRAMAAKLAGQLSKPGK
ncbi:MAG: oxidoreductase [Spirochaetaceae bacterium]|nr:oxidoreductase [Spirochaetaceae bacterium]|tara:strand:+ start:313591 stop:314376 length:786 start_codon:yes stop_codon:yes gene_type:complete